MLKHLDGDSRRCRHRDEVFDLPAKYIGTADRSAQHGLFEHGPERWFVGAGQDLLATHAQIDSSVDVLTVAERDNSASVIGCLQQTGNELSLVCADRAGSLFEAEVSLEPQRKHIAVLTPPFRLVGLADCIQEGLALHGIGNAVESEQVADVTFLEPGTPGFEAMEMTLSLIHI